MCVCVRRHRGTPRVTPTAYCPHFIQTHEKNSAVCYTGADRCAFNSLTDRTAKATDTHSHCLPSWLPLPMLLPLTLQAAAAAHNAASSLPPLLPLLYCCASPASLTSNSTSLTRCHP